jgi:hypothetical protein
MRQRNPRRPGHADIGRDEDEVHHFGEGYVGRVVDGDVVPELPTASQQRSVWSPAQGQLDQVGEGELGAARVEMPVYNLTPDHRCCLEVDQLRSDERLPPRSCPGRVPVGAIVCKRRREDAGVNDQHGPGAPPWSPR